MNSADTRMFNVKISSTVYLGVMFFQPLDSISAFLILPLPPKKNYHSYFRYVKNIIMLLFNSVCLRVALLLIYILLSKIVLIFLKPMKKGLQIVLYLFQCFSQKAY